MATYYVYAMCEPDGQTVRYIGMTTDCWKRLRSHISRTSAPKVSEWITGLLLKGQCPCIRVLAVYDNKNDAHDAEDKAIREHKEMFGEQILNQQYRGSQRKVRRGYIEFEGRKMSMAKWAKRLGITRQALEIRLRKHPVHIALSRGKDPHHRLDPTTPRAPSPRPAAEVDSPRAVIPRLSHADRTERRKKMASGVLDECRDPRDVALEYRVCLATVARAVDEECDRRAKSN